MNGNKEHLRIKYLSLRKSLSSYDVFIKSWLAQENLLNSLFFSKSRVIGVYYPILNEVQTFRIIRKSLSLKKKVCLPKIQDGKIAFYPIDGLNDLKIGIYNINEPQPTDVVKDEEIDTLIAPGIVFNRLGYRIGYGKGFYDRFLEKISDNDINIVGLGYDFQIFTGLITFEPHDFKMKALITNNEIFYV